MSDETPPVPSTQRRKRGLSLRSQLFNKTLLNEIDSHTTTPPPPPPPPDPSQSNIGSSNSFVPNLQPSIELEDINPPLFKIDEPSDPPPTAPKSSAKYFEPYKVLNSNLSRSTTHLTASSSFNDASSLHSKRERAAMKRFNTSNSYLRMVIELKNRLIGSRVLPATESGRLVPLSTNHKEVNSTFGDNYYDASKKGFIDERTNRLFIDNSVTSSKYSIYSFLPKQLRAQFSKIANCYFLVVAIMQMIPGWSTTGQYTTIIPLLIFISISMAREGFDDIKRHGHDKAENNKMACVIKEDEEYNSYDIRAISSVLTETMSVDNHLTPNVSDSSSDSEDNNFTNSALMSRYNLKEYQTKWSKIQVGDIVKVRENEWIPADLVLLATSNNDTQEAFVETMALDGETNLKPKTPHPELSNKVSSVPGLKSTKAMITVEDPNLDLYNFEGSFTVNGETDTYNLDSSNVVYRGSILRNTKSMLGLVVFTGEETKIRMNNLKNPRTKAPKLQKNINYIVMFMVCVVILLSAFSTMAQRILYLKHKDNYWYLYQQDAGVAATLMGFIIMYNTLIPLSLYVTMEIIKVMQLCFLQFDIDMYHVESNTPADAKTATILEELGQVGYIFSDKTGTLTDNKMIFRKFSVCGVSWIHDLDILVEERENPKSSETRQSRNELSYWPTERPSSPSPTRAHASPRASLSSIVRQSLDLGPLKSNTTWKSTAQPQKNQDSTSSLRLLQHIQSHPNTLFAKKAKFFLMTIALCNTCIPRRKEPTKRTSINLNISSESLQDITDYGEQEDGEIEYQAASPDELALVQAARDLGFVVYDRQSKKLTIKTYPFGFDGDVKLEEYQVLEVIEFSSVRKRMSVVVKFPDGRICLICKGADNIILEKLKNAELAKAKARDISLQSADRKAQEAEIVLQSRVSQALESRKSMSSFRQSFGLDRAKSFSNADRIGTIDSAMLHKEDDEIHSIASRARKSLHLQQAKRYSLDEPSENKEHLPNDRLLVNDEFILEKTLEHVEEFSTEGLRTLLYAFKWVDKSEYESWSQAYNLAKTELVDRGKKVEEVGGRIETSLELVGATAIEDKLQEGVSEAIEKLRRAGIKMWMLTGDKRETAINIGYSCRLIKDYSSVIVLSNDEATDHLMDRITSTSQEIQSGRVAHSVLVIDGSTLSDIESDPTLLSLFVDLCIQVDSTICCRASPSQKASMVSAVRKLNKKSVTLAIGDGANDIAMIQSADIGVGITGKEGLQAARSADYAIAQFRFLLKLLLVNGRYNYIRTSKFVLCTFYKELLFYLTQCVYQRNTLFSGSSMYESWSLSMFNTLFTSLPVLCVGAFDKDLKPATLLAVPELYSKGRLYQGFNLKIFVSWMILATFQSVGLSFLSTIIWGDSALRDNTTFPLGTMLFTVLTILINAKCEFIEMQNRQWPAFAAFIISVGGYAVWNVLIMFLYRSKEAEIFYVSYGLLTWGQDQSWWAAVLALTVVALLFDILIKVFKFMIKPNDDEIFRVFEKDMELRKLFEEKSYAELHQGWTFPRQPSTTRVGILKLIGKALHALGLTQSSEILKNYGTNHKSLGLDTSAYARKRAGTNPTPYELPPSGEGTVLNSNDFEPYFETLDDEGYEILPSGKRIKIKPRKNGWKLSKILGKKNSSSDDVDEDVDAIIDNRLTNLRREEEGI